MLFMQAHGAPAVAAENDYDGPYPNVRSVCGFSEGEFYPAWDDAGFGAFGYFFAGAPGVVDAASVTGAFTDLANAMIEQTPEDPDESQIPPIFTYIGQFIDHDITANTDREGNVSKIDVTEVSPIPRNTVTSEVANLRTGRLDLDSLYGGATIQGTFAETLTKQLRHPTLTAKLRIGTNSDIGLEPIEPPARDGDGAGDVLRLGRILNNGISEQDIRDLPDEAQKPFINTDLSINEAHAIIGDARNDENLAVAQFHLGMARFHNRVVDFADRIGGPDTDKGDIAYEFAQKQVRLHYQWLILNDYLPRICMSGVLDEVRNNRAPVYRSFFERLKAGGQANANRLPLPLEFSVAAFRFGHSMARPLYDWSKNFGREAQLKANASFADFFAFTGRKDNPFAGQGLTLPVHWIGDMSRMTDESGTFADRNTRAINTVIAPDLADMINEPEGIHARMRHLAERNLRRGHLLSVPSGQGCLSDLSTNHSIDITPLTTSQLEVGPGGLVLKAANMLDDTPLWYYVLREAEVFANGQTLGPLGSRLVAETLVGLLECDPSSVLHEQGASGAWSPDDGVQPKGEPITTFARLLRAADFHV